MCSLHPRSTYGPCAARCVNVLSMAELLHRLLLARRTTFRRLLRVMSVAFVLTFAVGCGVDPCVKLEERVCKTKKEKARCAIMQDAQRREHLSGEVCDSMLKALKR